jgi:hypothetical protein
MGASPGRTNHYSDLASGAGPAGTAEVVGTVGVVPAGTDGVVVVGVGAVAGFTFRPRNGFTPNSVSFSESGPKWSRTAVRTTSAARCPELPELLRDLLLAGLHRSVLLAEIEGLRDDAGELEPERLQVRKQVLVELHRSRQTLQVPLNCCAPRLSCHDYYSFLSRFGLKHPAPLWRRKSNRFESRLPPSLPDPPVLVILSGVHRVD